MTNETYNDQGAECPYCGHVNRAADSDGELYNESIGEWECGDCCKPFVVRTHVSWTWASIPYEDVQP